MGRAPCCDKANVKRGPWSPEEDTALKNYVEKHGTGGNWIALPRKADRGTVSGPSNLDSRGPGLKRCGKSCRLRWLNYLRPDIKHGGFTEEEDNIIFTLYKNIGSRWSVIASQLPGRTDNDVKNYWNTKLKKKLLAVQQINRSPSSPTPPPSIPDVKTESYCYGSPSMPIDRSLSMGSAFGFNPDPQRLVSEPMMFPMPGIVKPAAFDGSSADYVVSPYHDISAPAASAIAIENNCYNNPWSGNGGCGDDGFFTDFGFGSSYDSFNGYGFQEKILEFAPNCAPHLATLANFWANSDTKPQELYKNVTYS